MQTTVQDLPDTERTRCVCFISITLPVASTTEPHPSQVPAEECTEPQIHLRCRGGGQSCSLDTSQEMCWDLSQQRRLRAVPAGLTDQRQDNYLCVNGKLINHWNSVQRLSLDSSVVDLNVSIVTCEPPPCTAMGTRKATALFTKSFLYLWFSKQAFSCGGQTKLLKETKLLLLQ